MKLLEENVNKNLHVIVLKKDFLDITPKSQSAKANIVKSDNIKLKNLCASKDTIN